ncbi:MAG: hypothetical protein QNJ37_23230 [Crocosphaera sp.]|nr:hypothetical protein [Crocosphaera sp.]
MSVPKLRYIKGFLPVAIPTEVELSGNKERAFLGTGGLGDFVDKGAGGAGGAEGAEGVKY